MTDYNFIPILAEPREFGPMSGLVRAGLEWFSISDSFQNRLALLLGRSGDDHIGTLVYGGLAVMMVRAGSTMGDGEYELLDLTYDDEYLQEIHALFFENVIGDLPQYGDPWFEDPEGWPFDHPASVMVHERHLTQVGTFMPDDPVRRKVIMGNRPYNLYHDLMEYSGSQGFEICEMIGIIARSMYAANPEDLTEPKGF